MYTVVPDGRKGMTRKLHRNHLLPVTWPVVKDVKVKCKITKPQSIPASSAEVENLLSSEDSEDELPDVHVVVTQKDSKFVESGVESDGLALVLESSDESDEYCEIEFTKICSPPSGGLNDDAKVSDDAITGEVDAASQEAELGNNEVSEQEVSDNEDIVKEVKLRRSSRLTKKPDFYQASAKQVVAK